MSPHRQPAWDAGCRLVVPSALDHQVTPKHRFPPRVTPPPSLSAQTTPMSKQCEGCFGNFWRLGGRHGGSATSCFCADPCTHSVQDLNRLTCFGNLWSSLSGSQGVASPLPLPTFFPHSRRARQRTPPPTPPPPRPAGRRQREGRPQRHHGRHQNRNVHPSKGAGGQPVCSPAREEGGQGDFSQPSAHRRPTAAGKRPVQAGSPGLSTPSKPKRGGGVAGASTAGRAPAPGRHRPAAARGLFALGFTRLAAVMPPGDGGKGRASAPPRGSETPGKGHGRAHSEDT